MSGKIVTGVIALLMATTASVQAQDVNASPAYGSTSLGAGFQPDPRSVAVQAGGAISANTLDAYCSGFISHQPSHNLEYSAGDYELFLSAASDADTVLVVNAPDGSWHCNDDAPGQGLNAGISFAEPQSGLYNIWVGSLDFGGGYEPAMLHMSELGFSSENIFSRSPNALLQPNAASLSLRAGFDEDPRIVTVQAGGDLDGSRATSGQCWGSISEAPDVWLDYSANEDFDLYLSMESASDTTMMVLAPDGNWLCDDDSAGNLNPGIHIASPMSGRYAIWSGRFSDGSLADASLFVSELGFGGNADAVAVVDPDLPGLYGSDHLLAGFAPDPHSIVMEAGGGIDIFEAVGQECRGFTTTAPSYDLTYQAGDLDLYISAYSDRDATLVVNAPDGSWRCDDDSAGDLNPGLHFNEPLSGAYQIWVGTYSEGGEAAAALHVSELGFGGEFEFESGLDVSLPATSGSISLASGFLPDPFEVDLGAGGTHSAEYAADSHCRGYVNEAPTYELEFTSGELPLYISAASETDTTLVINAPDGSWICNDDQDGFNPGVMISEPLSGIYDIWVGTYFRDEGVGARMSISEIGFPESEEF